MESICAQQRRKGRLPRLVELKTQALGCTRVIITNMSSLKLILQSRDHTWKAMDSKQKPADIITGLVPSQKSLKQ